MLNMETLAPTDEKLLTLLNFPKVGQRQNQRVKIVRTYGKILSLEKLMFNIKTLELDVRTL